MMLGDVMQTIVDALNADEWLDEHYWKAVREDDGEIVNKIKANLESAGEGCLIIVSIGDFDSETSSSKKPIGPLQVAVSCMENAVLNRCRPKFEAGVNVAEHITCSLNLMPVGCDVLAKPKIKPRPVADGINTHNVLFSMHHVLEDKKT